ncbi:MAG TPA: hypothetical protein VFQ53_33140 [Kofleriaceae bacterium]|nr:hypothetical protein [Kofleriaceae bacterium]
MAWRSEPADGACKAVAWIAMALVIGAGCATASHAPRTAHEPAIAAHHAKAAPVWPSPLPLPALDDVPRARSWSDPFLIPPLFDAWPANAHVPNATQRAGLERLAARARGVERVALLDRCAAGLEHDAELAIDHAGDADVDFDRIYAPAVAAYRALVDEPGFAAYRHADAALYRAASLLASFDAARSRELFTRLVRDHASSPIAAIAHVRLGERAASDGDHATAEREFAAALSGVPASFGDYVAVRLAWARRELGQHARALDELIAVARRSSPADVIALLLSARSYAEIGVRDDAAAFYDAIAPQHTVEVLRRLAADYAVLGRFGDAAAILADVIERAPTCEDHVERVLLLERFAPPSELEAAITALVPIARERGDACSTAADALAGRIAWTWHAHPPARADAAQVSRMWDLAIELATTPERRAIALRDRAVLQGAIVRGDRRPAAWLAAAAKIQQAVAARPDDAALADIAVDTWQAVLALAPLTASERDRVREGLTANLDGPAGARARAVLATVR